MHLNIKNLLPKIDELRYITRPSNTAVIGLSESKLDKSIANSNILIQNHDILRCDQNRNGDGVTCYTRNDLSYAQKNLFPNDIELYFSEINLPKTKPITVGIVHRPLNRTNFIKTFDENFVNLKELIKKLGSFNINLYHNWKYIKCKNNTLVF